MKIYKIYNIEEQEAILATSLREVRYLVDLTNEQIKQLFYKEILEFNGYVIIAY